MTEFPPLLDNFKLISSFYFYFIPTPHANCVKILEEIILRIKLKINKIIHDPDKSILEYKKYAIDLEYKIKRLLFKIK